MADSREPLSAKSEIKALMLEMLTQAFQPSDVQATQQMGVNMSNAVKRDGGVVIIQNQNVEVYARIVPTMVKVLQVLDQLEEAQPLQITSGLAPVEAIQAEVVDDDDDDPIESCCAYLYEQGIRWRPMQDLMNARYLEYVVGRYKTKKEAAKMLGVGPTYLCKMTKAPAASPDNGDKYLCHPKRNPKGENQ